MLKYFDDGLLLEVSFLWTFSIVLKQSLKDLKSQIQSRFYRLYDTNKSPRSVGKCTAEGVTEEQK